MRIDRPRASRLLRAARLLAAAGLLALTAAPADAAFEDGVAAYQIGDFARALEVWRPLAEDGDAAAQFNLGIMYRQGEGVSRDYAAARRWFERASRQGNALAMFNIGLMTGSGQGVRTDLVEARRWMLLAAAAAEDDSRLQSDATYLGDLLRDQLGEEERARSVRRARDWAEANPSAVDVAALPEPESEPVREPEPRLAPLSADASSIVLDSARPDRELPALRDDSAVSAAAAQDGPAPAADAAAGGGAPGGARVSGVPDGGVPPQDTPPQDIQRQDIQRRNAPVADIAAASPAPLPAAAHRVQLASLDSADQARAAWDRFAARHPDLLADLSLHVEEATVGGRRYYRVQAGPLDAAGADGLCRRLRERGQDCLFVAP